MNTGAARSLWALALQCGAFGDIGGANGIQAVQGFELARLVPEAVGERVELRDLGGIGCGSGGGIHAREYTRLPLLPGSRGRG